MSDIYEFVDLFTENFQEISIWDLDAEKEIYRGTIDDLPDNLDDYAIMTIDALSTPTTVITINVSKEY